jgi:hypothetical protein
MKSIIPFFLFFTTAACGQNDLTLVNKESGLRLIVVDKKFPLLKILIPGQTANERGIEVEFPEHITGVNTQTKNVERFYLITAGNRNKRSLPLWKVTDTSVIYECKVNNTIKLTAEARLWHDGVSYTYHITNNSTNTYENLQAPTCVKMYSAFSDTLLERTYVHHTDGFDLLASETPERLTMGIDKWLPCRYLVPYTWPVNANRMEKDEDGITRYHKSRKVDRSMIATVSHDQQWVAATYTKTTGNVWTNPERTCHHVDPVMTVKPGETGRLWLKTVIMKGPLDVLEKELQYPLN